LPTRDLAVDVDPLSLLSRLATAVPPPRLHTVRYAGILALASKPRPTIVPSPPVAAEHVGDRSEEPAKPAGPRYRPWAELLKHGFAIDVLACPRGGGRMRLVDEHYQGDLSPEMAAETTTPRRW